MNYHYIGTCIALSLLICPLLPAFAQRDTLDSIAFAATTPTVELSNNRHYTFQPTLRIFTNSDLQKQPAQQLANLLDYSTGFFIKQYGFANLATMSNRGGTASQTQIIWEGISVQNPMLGQTDLNLLPLSMMDEVGIQTQSNSSFTGNASLGGTVYFQTQRAALQGVRGQSMLSVGSFGQLRQLLRLDVGGKQWLWRGRVLHQQANNDYPYLDINAFGYPKPIRRLSNSRLQQWSALQEYYLTVSPRLELTVKSWYQRSFRQLPPTLLQTQSDDQQHDESWRTIAQGRVRHTHSVTTFKQSFIWERLDYTSSSILSKSQFITTQTEVSHKHIINARHVLEFGSQYNYLQARSNGYSFSPSQHRLAAFAHYQLTNITETRRLTAHARGEYASPRYTLASAAVSMIQTFAQWHTVFINLAQNYRLPTFNDWYWAVGGNPNLRTEYSQQTEAGYTLRYQTNQQAAFIQLQTYSSWVQNLINWQPDPQTGLWSVFNVGKVWSRGIQAEARYRTQWTKHFASELATQYAYTRTSDQLRPLQQLLYTPLHKANAQLTIQYRQLSASYQHQYTAVRYLENSNQNALPAYQVANASASYRMRLPSLQCQLGIHLYNLWNVDYQIMANRPMPRRWLEVSVRLF